MAVANLRNLRVAETEKYAHVTYFFNGGIEKPFGGEDREDREMIVGLDRVVDAATPEAGPLHRVREAPRSCPDRARADHPARRPERVRDRSERDILEAKATAGIDRKRVDPSRDQTGDRRAAFRDGAVHGSDPERHAAERKLLAA